MKNRSMRYVSLIVFTSLFFSALTISHSQDTRPISQQGRPATIQDLGRSPRPVRRRTLPRMRVLGVTSSASDSLILPQEPSAPPAIEPQYVKGQVLIQLKPSLSDAVESATKNAFQTRAGILTTSEIGIESAVAASVNQDGPVYVASLAADKTVDQAITALQRLPGVEFAEPNWIYVKAQTAADDPKYSDGSLWGMYSDDSASPIGPNNPAGVTTNTFGTQAEKAWAGGHVGTSDTYVAILDEGIQADHPDLRDNMWTNPGETGVDSSGRDKATNGVDDDNDGYVDDVHGFDFFSEDGSVYDGQLTDDPTTPDINEAEIDSHGTHVAGTIGAVGGNSVGVAGVNWRVKMISTKFLGPLSGSTDKAIRAIDYLIMLKREKGLNIVAINASWGGGGYSRLLHNAIKRAAQANILFVAAAGNGDVLGNGINIDDRPYYPACYDTTKPTTPTGAGQPQEPGLSYDNVITVAALRGDGGIARFSNYGVVNVDLGAPGVAVLSTFPHGDYQFLQGTSMAAPHVTGAAALYASTHPSLSAAAIKRIILDTASATPTTSMNNKTATGGRANVSAF